MEFYNYPSFKLDNTFVKPPEQEYLTLDIDCYLDMSVLDKNWWPKNLKGLYIRSSICSDSTTNYGVFIPPTYLPDTLQKLGISYSSCSTKVQYLDIIPSRFIFINEWPLPKNLRVLSFFADKIYGTLPDLPSLQKLHWCEDTDDDFDDILLLRLVNIPDTVEFLQIYSDRFIDYTNFNWPCSLVTLMVSTEFWDTPLPSTLEAFACRNKADEGELEIKKDYQFPSNLKKLSIYIYGCYSSNIEPIWPLNLEKLYINMNEPCPFVIENLPKSLIYIKLNCESIHVDLNENILVKISNNSNVVGLLPKTIVKFYDSCNDNEDDEFFINV